MKLPARTTQGKAAHDLRIALDVGGARRVDRQLVEILELALDRRAGKVEAVVYGGHISRLTGAHQRMDRTPDGAVVAGVEIRLTNEALDQIDRVVV